MEKNQDARVRLTTQRESDFLRSKRMYIYTAANKAAIVGSTTAGINVSIPTHFPPASETQKSGKETGFIPAS
jgi:hypothetical protein